MSSSSSEILVAVMGPTGVGKSSFVRLVTGDDSVKVGGSLVSETNKVSSYKFKYCGLNFTLVDTPGFDDTWVDDRDVLRTLSLWLLNSYQDGRKLCGIIYLHRISDPRIQGSALRNFYMFKKLCGEDASKHIMLGTTFWDIFAADPSAAEARQLELVEKDEFWGGMVRKGAEVCKIPQDQIQARELLLKIAERGSVTLDLQRELVDKNKSPGDTELYRMLPDIKKLVKEHDEEVRLMVEQHERELMEHGEKARRKSEAQREVLEARLREQTAMTEKVQRDHDEKVAELTERIEELSLQREHTTLETNNTMLSDEGGTNQANIDPALSKIQISEPVTLSQDDRAIKYRSFQEDIRNTVKLLNNQQISGKVRCKFRPLRRANWAYCHNCMRTTGMGALYECRVCYDGHFQLCVTCYGTEGVYCNEPAHHSLMKRRFENNDGFFCRRINTPPQQGLLACSSCKAPVGSCFLHCCECDNDNFDLCLTCVLKGRKCKKLASSSGHPMSICFRYLDSQPTQIRPSLQARFSSSEYSGLVSDIMRVKSTPSTPVSPAATSPRSTLSPSSSSRGFLNSTPCLPPRLSPRPTFANSAASPTSPRVSAASELLGSALENVGDAVGKGGDMLTRMGERSDIGSPPPPYSPPTNMKRPPLPPRAKNAS